MSSRDRGLMLLVVVIWGVNFLAITWGLHDVPPLFFVAVRFALVAFPAVLFIRAPQATWWQVAAVGIFTSMGQFAFLYLALSLGMPSGIAALVLQAQVLLTIGFAAVWLGERPQPLQVTGVVLATAGLGVVALGRSGGTTLLGVGLCLAAATSWAVGNVTNRRLKLTGQGLSLVVWSSLVVPIPLVLLSLLVDGPQAITAAMLGWGWRESLSTLFTVALSTWVAYGAFNAVLSRNPTHQVVPWVLAVPIVAGVVAWLAYGETPAPLELVGALVMLAGLLLCSRGSLKPSASSLQPGDRHSEG